MSYSDFERSLNERATPVSRRLVPTAVVLLLLLAAFATLYVSDRGEADRLHPEETGTEALNGD